MGEMLHCPNSVDNNNTIENDKKVELIDNYKKSREEVLVFPCVKTLYTSLVLMKLLMNKEKLTVVLQVYFLCHQVRTWLFHVLSSQQQNLDGLKSNVNVNSNK